MRASTPSNVAEMLTLDKQAEIAKINMQISSLNNKIVQEIGVINSSLSGKITEIKNVIRLNIDNLERDLGSKIKMVEAANPAAVLRRGYAIISGKIAEGSEVEIRLEKKIASAVIKKVKDN